MSESVIERSNPDDHYEVPNLPRFAWAPDFLDGWKHEIWPASVVKSEFFAWLMQRPVTTIVGGDEYARTYQAAMLMRYWIERAKDKIPDNLRFYFDDAGTAMLELRRSVRDEGSNIVNILQYTKYLTLTEIHRLEPKDQAVIESIIRKRRNDGRFTVLTSASGMPNVGQDLTDLLAGGRLVKLA